MKPRRFPAHLDRPDHHIRMARVYLRQARETIHRDWFFVLLRWAAERRLRARDLMAGRPVADAWAVSNDLDYQAFRLVDAEAEQMGHPRFIPPTPLAIGQSLSLF